MKKQAGKIGCLGLIGLVFAAFFTALIISGVQKDERRAEEAAAKRAEAERVRALRDREKAENAAYFVAHKAEVMAQLQALFDAGDYLGAVNAASKYGAVDDPDLKRLRDKADELETYAKVRKLPANTPDDFELNEALYARLVKLNPEEPIYREKLELYQGKLAAIRKEASDRRARFGEPPERSGWDGSYLEVKTYLRQVMNDPDSLDMAGCTQVYHTKDGWLVGCDYRGKNAFGAIVMQSNWFTIRQGRVVNVEEADAYRP